MLGRVLAVTAVMLTGGGTAWAQAQPWTDDQLFPHGHPHWSRCWHLEHDYYALRDEIARTTLVWRRQELKLRWEQVRDARRETCLMGW